MPLFYYRTVDRKGKVKDGEKVAESKQEIVEGLQAEGLVVTTVEEKPLVLLLKNREEVAFFTRLLATMLKAGLSLTEALTDILTQIKDADLKKKLFGVLEAVLKGQPLHEGLRNAPAYFPPLYVHMVKAGESSHRLEESLNRLAIFYEKENALRQKVRTALTYPTLLVVLSLILVSFIMIAFVPKFVNIFKGMGVPLPLPTRILLFISSNFFWLLFFLLGAMMFFSFLLFLFASHPLGKQKIDRLKLHMPLFGHLLLKISLSRYLRTFATLYATGVPILEVLKLSREVLGNAFLQEKFSFIEREVARGERLADNLKNTGIFASPVLRFVAAGENTGSLAEMLEHGADFYDMEVDSGVERLSVVLEPVLLLIMGALVALIMLSTLLPMFQLIKTLRQ